MFKSAIKEPLDILIDDGILPAVELLNRYGFKTFESCQGGEGHCFQNPTVRFYGNEFDLIKAYELCSLQKMNVFEAKRVFRKVNFYPRDSNGNEIVCISNDYLWDEPFNEIEFLIHSKTGTIFREH
jgi:hypothetical protein